MKALIIILALTLFNTNAFAALESYDEQFIDEKLADEKLDEEISEFDPTSPDVEEQLKEFDEEYERQTGKSPFLIPSPIDELNELMKGSCYRNSCKIWADVDKAAQRIYLYIDGALTYTWKTSTGKPGYTTPNFDRHPNGRIYDRYTSSKYPGGDYNGLGNMPYAVFISGGYAIHGTPRGNWGRLGKTASHGCIRLHPDNGQIFNVLVRRNGILNVWVTVN